MTKRGGGPGGGGSQGPPEIAFRIFRGLGAAGGAAAKVRHNLHDLDRKIGIGPAHRRARACDSKSEQARARYSSRVQYTPGYGALEAAKGWGWG